MTFIFKTTCIPEDLQMITLPAPTTVCGKINMLPAGNRPEITLNPTTVQGTTKVLSDSPGLVA